MSRSEENGSARHRPKTYAEACEELGGAPWRTLEGTEQWFLLPEEDARPAADDARPTTLDTAAFRIQSSGLVDRLRQLPRGVWLTVGGMALVLTVVGVSLSSAHVAAAPPSVPVAAAPPRVAVATAPQAPRPAEVRPAAPARPASAVPQKAAAVRRTALNRRRHAASSKTRSR